MQQPEPANRWPARKVGEIDTFLPRTLVRSKSRARCQRRTAAFLASGANRTGWLRSRSRPARGPAWASRAGIGSGMRGITGARRGSPRLSQGRARQARARASPSQEKRLSKRAEMRELCLSVTVSPALAGCSWPALTGGLWHFWGSGFGKLLAGRRESCGAATACIIESRRSKGGLSGTNLTGCAPDLRTPHAPHRYW